VSLRARMTLLSAAGIAVVLAVASVATYAIVRDQLRSQVDRSLSDSVQTAGIVVAGDVSTGGKQVVQFGPVPAEIPLPPAKSVKVTVPAGKPLGFGPVYTELIDTRGTIVLRDDKRVSLPVPRGAVAVARGVRPMYFFDATVKGTHLRVLARQIDPTHAALLARPLTEVDRALHRLLVTLGLIGGLGIGLAAVAGVLVAHGALKPVRRLTGAVEEVARTRDLGRRIADGRRDEVGRLAASFDEMLAALEESLRAQRMLVSDASHELRTPLTSLRTNIEVLREGDGLSDSDRERLLADLGSEVEELSVLVADLVDLARGSQRELHLREARLDEIVEAVVERARARNPELEFVLAADDSAVIGDPDRLGRAIANLVDNAAKWSPQGGTIELRVAGGEVTVRDYGPGVSEADRPHVFERFYRSDEARALPGSGLGLAIVRQVAETHGGTVDVEPAEGGGSRFRLSLVPAPF
jgi:two-component system sensor histidine kinase MprB